MSTAVAENQLTDPEFWNRKYIPKTSRAFNWLKPLVRRKRHRMLAGLMDQMDKPAGDILELGCAPGEALLHLHKVRPQHRLHGIDYSEVGMQSAQEFLSRQGVQATIHFGDFREVELPQKFDMVMSFGLIEHFDDPVPVIRDHARQCVPGGRVAITVPNFATPVNRFLMKHVDPPGYEGHNLAIMSCAALRSAFEAAGLKNVKVGAAQGPRIYPGGDRSLLLGRINRFVSKFWNLAACLSPINAPWNYTLWAVGQVPNEGLLQTSETKAA
jgi:SAM-dependent methyltransferase